MTPTPVQLSASIAAAQSIRKPIGSESKRPENVARKPAEDQFSSEIETLSSVAVTRAGKEGRQSSGNGADARKDSEHQPKPSDPRQTALDLGPGSEPALADPAATEVHTRSAKHIDVSA